MPTKASVLGRSIINVSLKTVEELPDLFKNLRANIATRKECLVDMNKSVQTRKARGQYTPTVADHPYAVQSASAEELHSRTTVVGALIAVRWAQDDVKDSDWKPGWYRAVVQNYAEDEDTIEVSYDSKPECIYWIDVWPAISNGRIHLLNA